MDEGRNKTVFVACVSNLMESYKDNLINELEQLNYLVKTIATTDEINSSELSSAIEDCDFSIHILSDDDSIHSIDGKGMEESQIHMAMQEQLSQKLLAGSPESTFKIYVWYSKSLNDNPVDEENIPLHLKKIQQLEEVDLIQTTFGDFKFHLFNTIKPENYEEPKEFYIKGNNTMHVYFLYDLADKGNVDEYIEYLTHRGFNVLLPDLESDIINLRKQHNLKLKTYDLAIIFGKAANANWVHMKIMDILKSPGLGRNKPIQGKALLVSDSINDKLPPTKNNFKIVTTDQFSFKEQVDQILLNFDL